MRAADRWPATRKLKPSSTGKPLICEPIIGYICPPWLLQKIDGGRGAWWRAAEPEEQAESLRRVAACRTAQAEELDLGGLQLARSRRRAAGGAVRAWLAAAAVSWPVRRGPSKAAARVHERSRTLKDGQRARRADPT